MKFSSGEAGGATGNYPRSTRISGNASAISPILQRSPHRFKPMIQINAAARLPPAMAQMANRLSTIEVVAIAIIILSVAVLAFVGFAIWAEPPRP